MTARAHLLAAVAALHAELEAVRIEAAEEDDHWAGSTADMLHAAVSDVARAAEVERMRRGA